MNILALKETAAVTDRRKTKILIQIDVAMVIKKSNK